ncbi:hypothetical protein [Bacillus sp. RAR_GA_16]|uniref:hypothetical protein n=1 Tax=Bacillus sp. RAR_GA_16 TaxID=2876774 RepID=UPI001CCF5F95|nr:hypothetical protein [Bacillus sp. RAR_GA_16]MCA0174564.1 hypothetical protein [Bacillus sp. RAR_GA_16]
MIEAIFALLGGAISGGATFLAIKNQIKVEQKRFDKQENLYKKERKVEILEKKRLSEAIIKTFLSEEIEDNISILKNTSRLNNFIHAPSYENARAQGIFTINLNTSFSYEEYKKASTLLLTTPTDDLVYVVHVYKTFKLISKKSSSKDFSEQEFIYIQNNIDTAEKLVSEAKKEYGTP